MEIAVDPTRVCQLSCRSCDRITIESGKFKSLSFTLPMLMQIVESRYVDSVLYFGSGEPLLNRDFNQSIYELKKAKIKVSIDTNGQILSKKASVIVKNEVDVLSVSIDGLTQEVYEKYRVGGSLSEALAGVREVQGLKRLSVVKYPRVRLNYLCFEHNKHESVEDIVKFGISNGFDEVSIKRAYGDFRDLDAGTELGRVFQTIEITPKAYHQTRPRKQISNILDFHGIHKPIYMDFSKSNLCFRPMIRVDGEVHPCCWMFDQSMGNINDMTFDEICESAIYRDFLTNMMSPWGGRECNKRACKTELSFGPKYIIKDLLIAAVEHGKSNCASV